MHTCHARQYSTLKICALPKKKKQRQQTDVHCMCSTVMYAVSRTVSLLLMLIIQ